MSDAECVMPDCANPPADSRARGGLCETHLNGSGGDEADEPTETGGDENEAIVSPDAPTIETDTYPDMGGFDSWIPWADWDRKQPTAERYSDAENQYSYSTPANWTDHETARKWGDMDPELAGHGFVLQREGDAYADEADPYYVIDFDDSRDPETGRMHPVAIKLIERAGSYADVSTSWTGGHIIGIGSLPDGVKSIDAELPHNDEFPDASIEVYDGKRFVAMTGRHIEGTPTEPRETGGLLETLADKYATVSEAKPDAMTIEPAKTRDEIADVETTTDRQDVYDAIEHTRPHDIQLRSPVTEERGDGSKSLDPSWSDSDSGARLAQVGDGWVYRKGMRGLDALQVVALEERIIHDIDEYPSGEEFGEAVDALRERGAHIPEYEGGRYGSESEIVATLPDSPRTRAATKGLQWHDERATETNSTAPTQQEVYDRVRGAQVDAMESANNVVLDAIMGGGKTYNYFGALAEIGEKGAYFAPRIKLYEQAVEYAEANGFARDDCYILPSIKRDCSTWNGDHGDDQEQLVKRLYRLGALPKTIHNLLGDELGCKQNDSGKCEYEHRNDFEPDDYQVLIGHYAHAHLPHVTKGRHCAFDEDPQNAFTTTLGGSELVKGVNAFLDLHESPKFDGWDDLIQNRNDPTRKQQGLAWFDRPEFDFEPDERNAVRYEEEGFHAYAPLAVYTILNSEPLEDGYAFEHAQLPGLGEHGQFFTTSDQSGEYYVEFLTPPELAYTEHKGVLCLDGTPLVQDGRPVEWEHALHRGKLNYRQVLTDGERAEFLSETQGNVYLQTSEFIKPYSSGKYNNPTEDAALLAALRESYGDGEPPVVFTDLKVRNQYEEAGFVDKGLAKLFDHPGNLRGTNEYSDCRLAVQLGSSHHGDHEVRRRAAMLGETVDPEGKGKERDYGSEIGNKLVYQMREAQSAQNALRAGRDGNGALFVFDTCAFPDWIPVEEGVADVSVWNKTEQAIRDTWTRLSESEQSDGVDSKPIIEAFGGSTTEQYIRRCLNRLASRGYLEKKPDPEDGRKSVWVDAGLAGLGDHQTAEIELPDVAFDGGGSGGESTKVSRSSSLVTTSDFRTSFKLYQASEPPLEEVSVNSGEAAPGSNSAVNEGGDSP